MPQTPDSGAATGDDTSGQEWTAKPHGYWDCAPSRELVGDRVVTVDARVPDEVAATRIERAETAVMFLRTADEPVEIRRGWERLEALVGLRGRKFYGAFDPVGTGVPCVRPGESR
jgi:hypothetical protein